MCCKVMGVPDLVPVKRVGAWCQHCQIGKGCGVYKDRPQSCRDFACIWLQGHALPERMRPDRTGVVIWTTDDGEGVTAHCDPKRPTEWRKPDILDVLKLFARDGRLAQAIAGDRHWIITPSTEWEVPESLKFRTPDGGLKVAVPDDVKAQIGLAVRRQYQG